MIPFIDTHAHLDGEEFRDDLPEVVQRARAAGVGAILVPGIDDSSVDSVMAVCRRFPGYCYPMIGLQPEEVRPGWADVLARMKRRLEANLQAEADTPLRYVAVGECGLDYFRLPKDEDKKEFEKKEQKRVFRVQLDMAAELNLPPNRNKI